MAIYEIKELIDSLLSAKSDGYEYVDISELPEDEDGISVLNLDFCENHNTGETDMIDSVNLPNDYQAPLK